MTDTMQTAPVNVVGLKKALAKAPRTPRQHKTRFALRAWRLCEIVCFALLAGVSWAGESPAEPKHLGVATCASSVCHGRVEAAQHSYAALNEYRVWAKRDYHSRAYRLLKNDASRRIAANMGLGKATDAPECLVCHADYVPPAQRGERFHLSDGIGCEACHGGAEHWIDTHYGPKATHAANLEAGMQPTEDPFYQARLCQSCHLGDTERFATHEMMAAGHPRLRFELDTWLTLMPPHHVEDADYRQRKGEIHAADRWAAGMAVAAGEYLDVVRRHVGEKVLTAELAVFDCHACHRPMDRSGDHAVGGRELPVGAMRLNDNALQVLTAIALVRDRNLGRDMQREMRALNAATTETVDKVRRQAGVLQETVTRLGDSLQQQPLSGSERDRLTTALLRRAAGGAFRDYADAEQLYLGLQVLAVDPASPDLNVKRYNGLYSLVDDEQAFDPRRFANEARRLLQGVSTE